ncbi:hypothetical protein IX51_10410 [uncultured archaeon]|nr:hypothetical protein IX51_10410 [uncultured archaeon]
MALASVAFSISAFSISAFLSGLFLLGKDQGENSGKTLGIINVLVGISIFISSILLFTTVPFGTGSPAENVQLGFSVLQVFFGIVWISFGASTLYNWDMKFIGSTTLLLLVYNVIVLIVLPISWSAAFTTVGMVVVELALFSYILDEFGFWAVTHGKMKATVQGYFLIASSVLSIALAVIPGGIIPM